MDSTRSQPTAIEALQAIEYRLRAAGATLPGPPALGTIESAMQGALCVALALVVCDIEDIRRGEHKSVEMLQAAGVKVRGGQPCA